MAQHLHLFLPLLQILSLLLVSSAQTRPPTYFMNVGSKSDIPVNDRTFYGDMNPGTFSVGKSDPVSAKSSTDIPLYQTARIFLNPSSYEFDIIDHGVYFVRLHFYPYMLGKANLVANISFNVSLPNYSLLSEFGVKQTNDLPVIEEFLVSISDSKLSINFTPHPNSIAFVNAIEVFLFPRANEFIFLAFPVINARGIIEIYSSPGQRPAVLRTLHRVNVGGPGHNDSLWRTWIPDDPHVIDPRYQKTCTPFTGPLRYILDSTPATASDLVYSTCKHLSAPTSIISWQFAVAKSARHLLRLHFCDIVSPSSAAAALFNVSIYDSYAATILARNTATNVDEMDAPFYWDFLIETDALGGAVFTIMSLAESKFKDAYLNGIEIFQLSTSLN